MSAIGPKPEYGNYDNINCIAQLKEVYRQFSGGKHSKAHDHAIEMMLVKIGRIATGVFHSDNYADIRGYANVAQNIVEGEQHAPWEGKPVCSTPLDEQASLSTDSSAVREKALFAAILDFNHRLTLASAALRQTLDILSSGQTVLESSLTTFLSQGSSAKTAPSTSGPERSSIHKS